MLDYFLLITFGFPGIFYYIICFSCIKIQLDYEKIIYIGDGVSDYCVADKADILYAKKRLLNYCVEKGIKHISYNDFSNIKINF